MTSDGRPAPLTSPDQRVGIAPVACTLTTKDMAGQKLEWADLAGLALSIELIEGGAKSTFATRHERQVRGLAEREAICCGSWLEISIENVAGGIELRLSTANPDGVDLIRSMAGAAPGAQQTTDHRT